MQEKSGDPGARLRDRLHWFVFFHLGADAELEVRDQGSLMTVSVRHHRVKSFEFRVEPAKVERWLENPGELERFLLEQLTRHRR